MVSEVSLWRITISGRRVDLRVKVSLRKGIEDVWWVRHVDTACRDEHGHLFEGSRFSNLAHIRYQLI